MKLTAKKLAAAIDHTYLKAAGDLDAIHKLCREAKKYGFATVCVNPVEVASAVKLLKGCKVKVGTVVGFPLGQNHMTLTMFEARMAISDGARELDFVINQRMLKAAAAGDRDALWQLRLALRTYVDVKKNDSLRGFRRPSITTKLILECCNLTDEEKKLGCQLAKEAGFDFVKTSTGFAAGGATVADVKLMRKAIGPKMGVKAAGGIRTLADARALLKAGATRLGCSNSVKIMKELGVE